GRAADLICGADRERVLGCLRKIIESGKEDRFECGIKRADNSIADTEWSVTWSQEEESLYCVIHDITARKNLERMKAEFVAMVSHEIRTPLSSIQMTHSILESELGESLDPFMTKSLVVAKDNVTRLMALVNNLLDLDKLESGFIEFLPENEAAWQVVETSINAIESLFKKKSIEVKHNIDPNLYIYADRERLVQVLINLLGNAIKYSEPGSKITVKARKESKAVRFSVSDTGRGIPADKLSTIFERFRQVEASDEKVHKGAGLGLAISKAIIERHKGKMGVDSTLGEGSTFWFTVPAGEGKLGD
ncbi:MAG TPA: PAS domain-containing sensor histidine kinase, partial [Candidatus Obscuribacter sp.]|nr:PAS domain-containing sensor histidine kinase [Candidatus Obscuribacter sp.]